MASNRAHNLLESKAYTGITSTRLVDNVNNPSAHFIIDINTLSSGQRLTLDVIGVGEAGITEGDPNGRAQYILFTSETMNQAVDYRFVMGPNVECVPGIACRDFIPKWFFMRITPFIPAQSDTYSVDVSLGLG
jgi:hypothetical protein